MTERIISVSITNVDEVRELIAASDALDALMSRSYEPMSMSKEYQRFHDALQKLFENVPR
jgi:hypothetical protein